MSVTECPIQMPVRWAGVQQYVGQDDTSTLGRMTAVRWAAYSSTLSSVPRYAVHRTSVRTRAYCHKDKVSGNLKTCVTTIRIHESLHADPIRSRRSCKHSQS